MRTSQRGDWAAMALSLSCAVHCILQPLLIAAIPLVGSSFLSAPGFEAGSILLTLFISLKVMRSAHAQHRRHSPLLLLGGGCFLLILDALARMDFFQVSPEWALTASGCLFLMMAHFVNLQCRG